jgi:glycosyltransferase involved in cell wall biosynthesis
MAYRASLQLCTFNRAHLLGRVLDACFEQTVPDDAYEVVLVDDGSSDGTAAVIEAAKARANCAFTVVSQANAGLARARNAGIARANGERIIFFDDDVLPTPSFVEQHLRSHERYPERVVRGAVIMTESFERLPAPVWTPANYSGNWFWTSNVSVPLATVRRAGNFTETFAEYGWEDIELGLRLRGMGVKGTFNRFAVAFHYKPRPQPADLEKMLRQARAQARTAVQLRELHDTWRVVLATGDDPVQRTVHRALRAARLPDALRRVADSARERPLSGPALLAARALASETYFDELERARNARAIPPSGEAPRA